MLVIEFCAVATHGVAHLGPEDGEVVLLVGRAVADDFHQVGRAVIGTDVVACQAVACAVHAQGLHIDVACGVVLLIEHGDDGMLTDAVHEETLRIDGVVDQGDLVATALDGSELELAVVASRVEGVASHADAHEHGVVAHHQVVVGSAGVFVEMHQVDGLRPLLTIVERHHKVSFEGGVVDGVALFKGSNVLDVTTLPHASGMSVVLNGDHGLAVKIVVGGGDVHGVPGTVALSHRSNEL